jgi:hypothetical protein
MARMRARGGLRRFRRRALSAALLVTLVTGAVAAAVWVPGAEGRPQPTATRRDASSVAIGPSVTRRRRAATPPAVIAVPASLAVPAAGADSNGYVADPTTEAQVAADLVVAIDTLSNGRYSIVATPDNISLLETWMDNEGGLWADNPLNTSLDADRFPHQVTSSGQNTGIPVFPNIKVGIDATAQTLLSGHAYVDILWVLSEGSASCDSFARAVMASPWAASHYGGNPAHFCGNSGGSATPGTSTAACLRLRNRGNSVRMPGLCGHKAGSAAAGHTRHHGLKPTKASAPTPLHHHGTGRRASPAAGGHGAGHGGSVRSRR